MHVTVPATANARTQHLLAPCKHTLLLLERQAVVQPHGVPIVSRHHVAGGRAHQRLLRRLLDEHTSRASLPTTPARAQGCIKPEVHIVLQLINIPFRTTCRDIWETTQTWPLPTNVLQYAFRIYADRRQR